MEAAFEHRDKSKYPTEIEFSQYLHTLDDRQWKSFFTSLITRYKSEIAGRADIPEDVPWLSG